MLFIIICNAVFVYAQDTLKAKTDTVSYKPLTFILSDHKYSYINPTNPDTVTRKRFLWYPTKTFEDIFNYLPGYYLNYMDVGQFNLVKFNQSSDFGIMAVLRNGRPMNDFYGAEIDWNLLSKNEIDQIEISNGYGNFRAPYTEAVNIIQRQLFVNRAYTEISFTQDRFENLYFDGNFHQNLFRNLNFNFGITKHSYDGKYTNSDFDKWLGRFNLNFAASNKLNFFAYVNYASIKKGDNGGIIADTINLGIKDEVFDPALAIVRNSDSYEKKERFDIDAGAVFNAGKSSYTKLQLYMSNSFLEQRDEENRINPNGYQFSANKHWVLYGAVLQQIFDFKIKKDINITSRTEGEYYKYFYRTDYSWPDENILFVNNLDRVTGFTELSLKYKNTIVSGYGEGYTIDHFKTSNLGYGLKASHNINIDSATGLNVYASYTRNRRFYTGGVRFTSGNNYFSAAYYNFMTEKINTANLVSPPDEYTNINGMNFVLRLRLYKFDLNVNFSSNFKLGSDRFPKYYGNAELSFHDMGIRNKLEYKIGFVSRGWSKHNYYDGVILANATLDFFIMAKIGRATFGLTVENVLDRIIYNTAVYPYMDRGGFVNAISRFNITWNFTD